MRLKLEMFEARFGAHPDKVAESSVFLLFDA